jgi:hypothetical protein
MPNTLYPGQTLNKGGRLESNNRKYELHFELDGNLVLYQDLNSRPGTEQVAESGTRANRAVMQQDGNFVIYDSAGVSRWDTGTWDNPGSKLVLQDDREVVILSPNNRRLWAWGTRQRVVEMPWVTGYGLKRATSEITRVGLTPEFSGDCSGGKLATGEAWIMDQSPSAGSRVLLDDTVELVCSSEPEP